ncbi:MAG: hypothetical protein ABIR24_00505 [Verrucomicrobiota bacterium]
MSFGHNNRIWPVYSHAGFSGGKPGNRHQTDTLAYHKPKPRAAMTK